MLTSQADSFQSTDAIVPIESVPPAEDELDIKSPHDEIKHFAEAFTGGRVADVLCKRPAAKLLALFPVLANPGHLNRHAIQLRPDPTDPDGPAKFNRLTNPLEWPISDHAMWRQWAYRSYSPWQHIGLPQNFVQKVEEALTENQPRPFFDAVRDKTLSTQFRPKPRGRERLTVKQLLQGPAPPPVKLEQERDDEFIKITFCYCTPKGIDANTPLTLAVQPNCPMDQLAIPIFGIQTNLAKLPELLPKIALYDLDGQALPIPNDTILRPTVGDVKALMARFVSFRSYLFRITFDHGEIIPSSSGAMAAYYLIQAGSQPHHCEACAIHVAEVEVSESIKLPLSPTYLCADCYNEIFPDGDDGNRTDIYLTELLL